MKSIAATLFVGDLERLHARLKAPLAILPLWLPGERTQPGEFLWIPRDAGSGAGIDRRAASHPADERSQICRKQATWAR